MKFGKEFISQMVPEWHEAYMDYDYLKTLLKEIQNFKLKNKPPPASNNLKRRLTLYRAFSGLTQRNNTTSPNSNSDIENQPILVGSVNKENGEVFETMFLRSADEGGEYELVYFRRLDEEFNKVVKFYKTKVEEVVGEANVLNKQMDALIAFRIKVDNPQVWFDSSVEMTRLASDVATSTAALAAATPFSARSSTRELKLEMIEEEGSSSDDNKKTDDVDVVVEGQKWKKSRMSKSKRPAPLDILNHMTMNNTVETPRSTIKEFLNIPNQTELQFSRSNLKKVEEQLKKAFVEFHHKLRLLKSFGFLNMLAFSKIMKKYDKVSARSASKSYMKMVDNSYLGSSDEVSKLMERVEATFIKHFANSNRSKGMNILRPKPRREKHRTTFSLGFLAGGTAALLLALVLIIRTRHVLHQDLEGEKEQDRYMRTMFPLYSLFGYVVLHLLMYGANIYFWRRYRVNYSFIFGFKEGTELGYREVLLVGFSLSLLALAGVLSNLDMQINKQTVNYKAFTELLPAGLVVLVFVILFCPLNIIYRSSRYFLLTCLLHCVAAPLYKVVLPDFFLADQLTSQVQALRSLQFYICYYGSGDYKFRETSCRDHDVFKTFLFIVAGIPYLMRLLQCLRRLYEEKDMMQGLNGVKYFLTIVAVSTRTAFSLKNTNDNWLIIAWITSIIAMIFGIYWDLVIDWGLLDRNSKNWLLRDKLLVQHKSVYFIAMVLNVVLRFAWLQTVLKFEVPFLHTEMLIAVMACLEIMRRGLWNFFRLENEHLNNVGKYRAFKSVPLPFNYDEDQDKED